MKGNSLNKKINNKGPKIYVQKILNRTQYAVGNNKTSEISQIQMEKDVRWKDMKRKDN